MSCCGQNRIAYANSQQSEALQGTIGLKFAQRRSIAVRGRITGLRYVFHDGAFTRGIDPRDAADLLKSGHFEKMPA
jgi:hypothetical protein